MDFSSGKEDDCHDDTILDVPHNLVFLTSDRQFQRHVVLLDTQSAIHLISDNQLLVDIQDAVEPITVQGITGDRIAVTSEGVLDKLGIIAYHAPHVSANILSYHKLQETHSVTYSDHDDTFTATPFLIGPNLLFTCVNGHYTLDMSDILNIYMTASNIKASRYSKRQLQQARAAYDFIIKMGFISYKAAAEVVQRGSVTNLGFTRADLVNAQDIYGTPAAYQLGQGTQKTVRPSTDDPIPLHESVEQELQVDLFYFLGNVFLLSISVLLGLIMITHLGPGIDRSKDKPTSDRQGEGPQAKAGAALVNHITQYHNKGFLIKRVTSDGEGSIKASRPQVESLGADLNILGHGSHTPHAKSAIRHIKNKARSTIHSLPYVLPAKLCAALISFVVHTANMVPKINSPGHLPAHTSFLGRIPNFRREALHPFGIAGFLQRASHSQYNTASPRGDFCIWLGTTHNLAGTNRCFNLDTLREVTGDVFRPTMITPAAILRLSTLAGVPHTVSSQISELILDNPTPPYPLDPARGVEPDVTEDSQTDIVAADDIVVDLDLRDVTEVMSSPQELIAISEEDTQTEEQGPPILERAHSQALELVTARNNNKYTLRSTTLDQHVYSTLSIKAATKIYGKELSDKATRDELMTCIQKDVWECLDSTYVTKNAIPSRMFLTPKTLPNGELDRIKGRIVAGGHRQDKSPYEDKEISSPTVALTSVLTIAALAAKEGKHVMTLDHKAAYLNATMEGPPVEMLISPEVVEILCEIDTSYKRFIRPDNKIAVRLKKALYGCVQSAMLWYIELTATLEGMGFQRNPYDTC
jgi:Reverse transcriptase (RNA-dependent DNA polymerase)